MKIKKGFSFENPSLQGMKDEKNRGSLSRAFHLSCLLQESDQGHMDFQSIALPTELKRRAKNVYSTKAFVVKYSKGHFYVSVHAWKTDSVP